VVCRLKRLGWAVSCSGGLSRLRGAGGGALRGRCFSVLLLRSCVVCFWCDYLSSSGLGLLVSCLLMLFGVIALYRYLSLNGVLDLSCSVNRRPCDAGRAWPCWGFHAGEDSDIGWIFGHRLLRYPPVFCGGAAGFCGALAMCRVNGWWGLGGGVCVGVVALGCLSAGCLLWGALCRVKRGHVSRLVFSCGGGGLVWVCGVAGW